LGPLARANLRKTPTLLGPLARANLIHCMCACMHQLLVTANIPSSPILVTLMLEAVRSSEMSVLTRATWHNIPEYDILLLKIQLAESHNDITLLMRCTWGIIPKGLSLKNPISNWCSSRIVQCTNKGTSQGQDIFSLA
jgi:hypothetical protein